MKKAFPKTERLCSKKLTEELFSKGSSFLLHPIRVQHLLITQQSSTPLYYYCFPEQAPASSHNRWQARAIPLNPHFPVQIMVAVPKRRFKQAVMRNTLKRRVKEAFRLNKHLLQPTPSNVLLLVAFQYIAKEPLPYAQIERKLQRVLTRLNSIYFAA